MYAANRLSVYQLGWGQNWLNVVYIQYTHKKDRESRGRGTRRGTGGGGS